MTDSTSQILSETSYRQSESAIEKQSSFVSKAKDYFQFVKFRLSFLVVFSAAAGYVMASTPETHDWKRFFIFILGGFLVTAASNAFNQIIERDTDKLMERTKNRPLPANRMSVSEATVSASVMAISGVCILTYFMNPLCGLLSAVSLILYTVVYTPLKKVSPVAVFVGAIPGAMPPLIGWVAVSGEFSFGAILIFSLQFIWQFPHFWAIAWVTDDDYQRAGFRLLPSKGGKNKMTAIQIVAYASALIPIGFLPMIFHITGIVSVIIVAVAGIVFTWQALRLLQSSSDAHARQLMFGSFLYLPVVLISFLADKI